MWERERERERKVIFSKTRRGHTISRHKGKVSWPRLPKERLSNKTKQNKKTETEKK
jgi:hypothetical protein